MASGDTLCVFTAMDNEPPAANFAQFDTANTTSPVPVLAFDTTTAWAAIFTSILPRNYAGGGITVYVHSAMASAITGTLGWTVEFERFLAGTDNITAESWASAQTITATTVPGTAGIAQVLNVAVSNGANMDSIAVGEGFRLRIKRDVSNDTAAGNALLYAVELKET
mgnify:CR=1 FL=1